MKRVLFLLLALVLVLSLAACGAAKPETTQNPAASSEPVELASTEPSTAEPATRVFTDSLGREVEVPTSITKLAVSGPLAQIVLFALCPDKLVGIASEWDKTAANYLATEYYNLPILGQLYGGKGELNLEALLASGAEVVIDVGEPKDTAKEDLDALQEQTGVPFVHITAMTDTTGNAYRMLGDLLGMPEEAEALASYCEKAYGMALDLSGKAEKARLLYLLGDTGLNVLARGSYHAEIIDLLADNQAVVEAPSSKGGGNEIDMEQLLIWDPDVILFAPGSIYATVGEDSMWQQLTAIRTGRYYEVPMGPYNWLGSPPSVQRYLGMLWMMKLLYPEQTDYDLKAEVQKYYQLFYHCELTDEQYDALVANSIDKES